MKDPHGKGIANHPAPESCTGGHSFNEPKFLRLFQGYDDIAYKHLPQKAGGEVFDNGPTDALSRTDSLGHTSLSRLH